MKKQNKFNLGIGFLLIGILLVIYNWWSFTSGRIPNIYFQLAVFPIRHSFFTIPFAGIIFLFGIAYFILHVKKIHLLNSLSIIHTILTVVGITIFFRIRLGTRRGVPSTMGLQYTISLGIFIFSVSIIIGIVNIIISAIRNKKKKQIENTSKHE